jgi:hypothetical protein
MIKIKVPIRTKSPNKKEHWTKTHKQNNILKILIKSEFNKLKTKPSPPCTVTLTRIAPRQLDYDNLVSSFKGLRDIIADQLIPNLPPGQADGDIRLKWAYTQKKGDPKEYSVEIAFSSHWPEPIIL